MNEIRTCINPTNLKRIISQVSGDDGPTVVFFGGIHGNEPSGVLALQTVFRELEEQQVPIHGRVIGLAGNLTALQAKQRFISKDLNRIWSGDFIEQTRNGQHSSANPPSDVVEEKEQRELFDIIRPILDSGSEIYFVDLHTTSSQSAPFIAINDQLINRNFAFKFPVATVLGIEEYLEGTLLSLLNEYGHVAVAFEAGQHDDPESIQTHRSFVYMAMLAAGVIREADLADIGLHRERLQELGEAHHGAYEVVYRKPVTDEDEFVMDQGYTNFSPIDKRQAVAKDRSGPVLTTHKGRIFMPRYQNIGNDGFFIVRSIPGWALRLSSWLRNINFDRFLTWLPGVSRAPDQADALLVNRRIARVLATEIFHLLGYRRKQAHGDKLIFSRREIRSS